MTRAGANALVIQHGHVEDLDGLITGLFRRGFSVRHLRGGYDPFQRLQARSFDLVVVIGTAADDHHGESGWLAERLADGQETWVFP